MGEGNISSGSKESPSVSFLVMSFQKIFDSTIFDAGHDPTRLGNRNLGYAILQDNLPPLVSITMNTGS